MAATRTITSHDVIKNITKLTKSKAQVKQFRFLDDIDLAGMAEDEFVEALSKSIKLLNQKKFSRVNARLVPVIVGEHLSVEAFAIIYRAFAAQNFVHIYVIQGVSNDRYMEFEQAFKQGSVEFPRYSKVCTRAILEINNPEQCVMLQDQHKENKSFLYCLKALYSALIDLEQEESVLILGYLQYRERDYISARKNFEGFIQHYPKGDLTAVAHYYLAMIALLNDRHVAAKKHMNHFLERFPTHAISLSAMIERCERGDLNPAEIPVSQIFWPWVAIEAIANPAIQNSITIEEKPTLKTHITMNGTFSCKEFIDTIQGISKSSSMPVWRSEMIMDVPLEEFVQPVVNHIKNITTKKHSPLTVIYFGTEEHEDYALRTYMLAQIYVQFVVVNVNEITAIRILDKIDQLRISENIPANKFLLNFSSQCAISETTLQRAKQLSSESAYYNMLYRAASLYHSTKDDDTDFAFEAGFAALHLDELKDAKKHFTFFLENEYIPNRLGIAHYFMFYIAIKKHDWDSAERHLRAFTVTNENDAIRLRSMMAKCKKDPAASNAFRIPLIIEPQSIFRANIIENFDDSLCDLSTNLPAHESWALSNAYKFSESLNSYISIDICEHILGLYPHLFVCICLAGKYFNLKEYANALRVLQIGIKHYLEHPHDPLEVMHSKPRRRLAFIAYKVQLRCHGILDDTVAKVDDYDALRKLDEEQFVEEYLGAKDFIEFPKSLLLIGQYKLSYEILLEKHQWSAEDHFAMNSLAIMAMILDRAYDAALEHSKKTYLKARTYNTNIDTLEDHDIFYVMTAIVHLLKGNSVMTKLYFDRVKEDQIKDLMLAAMNFRANHRQANEESEEICYQLLSPLIDTIDTNYQPGCVLLLIQYLNQEKFYQTSFRLLVTALAKKPSYMALYRELTSLLEIFIQQSNLPMISAMLEINYPSHIPVLFKGLFSHEAGVDRAKFPDSLVQSLGVIKMEHEEFTQEFENFINKLRENIKLTKDNIDTKMLVEALLFKARLAMKNGQSNSAENKFLEIINLIPEHQEANVELEFFQLSKALEQKHKLDLQNEKALIRQQAETEQDRLAEELLKEVMAEVMGDEIIDVGCEEYAEAVADHIVATDDLADELINVAVVAHQSEEYAQELRQRTLDNRRVDSTVTLSMRKIIEDEFNSAVNTAIDTLTAQDIDRLFPRAHVFFKPKPLPVIEDPLARRLNVKAIDDKAYIANVPLSGRAKIVYDLLNATFKTLLVGGYVRDALLGKLRQTKDCDFVVFASIDDIDNLLSNLITRKKFKEECFVRRGQKIQSIELQFGLDKFDICSLSRIDLSPEVNILESSFAQRLLKNDTDRRDLRMNALYYDDVEKIIYDPSGGVEDINANLLSFVESIETCQVDNAKRILRAIRLQTRYSELSMTEEDIAYIKSNSYLVLTIPLESRLQELKKWVDEFGLEKSKELAVEFQMMKYLDEDFRLLVPAEETLDSWLFNRAAL